MAASLCPLNTQVATSHSAISIGSRKDWIGYLREPLFKIPPAPPTSVVIEEITESSMDSGAPAPKNG